VLGGSLSDSLPTLAKNSRASLMMKLGHFIMLESVHEKIVATAAEFPNVDLRFALGLLFLT